MEISCHLYSKQVPMFSTKSCNYKLFHNTCNYKLNSISCRARARANTLETQRVTSNKNLYEVLSLESSENVSFDEIKKAYRSMARQYHPDVVPASRKEESTQRFVELQQAYETLSDPISRQKYDYELRFSYSAVGFGFGFGLNGGISRTSEASYSKDVWEDQLRGLQSRSHVRMTRKQSR